MWILQLKVKVGQITSKYSKIIEGESSAGLEQRAKACQVFTSHECPQGPSGDHSLLRKVRVVTITVRITFGFHFIMHSVSASIRTLFLMAKLELIRAGASIPVLWRKKSELRETAWLVGATRGQVISSSGVLVGVRSRYKWPLWNWVTWRGKHGLVPNS